MSELKAKPCPCCGSDLVRAENNKVECLMCQLTLEGITTNMAVYSWNQRKAHKDENVHTAKLQAQLAERDAEIQRLEENNHKLSELARHRICDLYDIHNDVELFDRDRKQLQEITQAPFVDRGNGDYFGHNED